VGEQGPAGCNPHVETRHELPAQLSESEERHIGELVTAVLGALEIREGASHTEILLTEAGPRLLECHTRPGGDHITDMYLQCTGIDLVELAIGAPLGLCTPPPAPARIERGAALHYFTPPAGRLMAVSGLESSANLPGVVLLSLGIRPGAEIVELKSSSDRVGYVMAIAPDAQAASATCQNVLRRVKLDVEPQSAG
jgi:biotin carboxylase